jgi:hypothetical protein
VPSKKQYEGFDALMFHQKAGIHWTRLIGALIAKRKAGLCLTPERLPRCGARSRHWSCPYGVSLHHATREAEGVQSLQ